MAAPWLVPSSVLGAEGRTPPGGRVGMGFIGLGGQGSGHLGGGAWTYLPGGYLATEGVQVLGVCDVWRDRRERARDMVNGYYAKKTGAGAYRACEAYVDFRELLARDDLDAVLIATPIHWHALMTILAAKAGKDVYCEKPTAVTLGKSRAVAETVRRYGRVFQAGTQQRSEYGEKFYRACELVRNGRIGEPKCAYAYCPGGYFQADAGMGRPVEVPEGFDWDLWLGPAPWRPYANQAHAHLFGDGGINWGQHHYDIVQWGLGTDDTGPVEIGFEDGTLAYRYANGVVVYGGPCPGQPVGGSGGACFVGSEGRIAVDREHLVAEPAKILDEPRGPDDVPLYRSTSHSRNFLDCVRTRERTICDAETAHRAASVMLLGGIAMRLGRTLRWDPAREVFEGDDEADRLRNYALREPWRA